MGTRVTKSRKKGFLCVLAALALTIGIVLPNVSKAWAAQHTITFDDSCTFAGTQVTEGVECTVGKVNYMIYFGYLTDDGGFINYDGQDIGEKADMGNAGKSITFTDDAFFEATYMHLDGDDQVVDAYIDGKAEHFSAGNIQATHADGKIFGIGERVEEDEPHEGDDGEGGPMVYLQYGAGDGQTYGGEITLEAFCEPAWAYDEDAEPGTYADCVETNGESLVQEGLPYGVIQGAQGGEVWAARGIKLKFKITPYEDYEFVDADIVTEPEDVELDIEGMGGADGAEFEFDMPENLSVRITAYFEFVSENAIPVMETDEACGYGQYPTIMTAEAEDAPENAYIKIYCNEDDDINGDKFAKDLYGDLDEFETYVDSLYDEGKEEDEIIGIVMTNKGQVMAMNFSIGLFDFDTGEEVAYNGNGITITLAASDWLGWFGGALEDYYDGEFEVFMAHLKTDGSIEYIPVEVSEGGIFKFTTKSMSPFAIVAKAISGNNANPSTDDNILVHLGIAAAIIVVVCAAIFAGRKSMRE